MKEKENKPIKTINMILNEWQTQVNIEAEEEKKAIEVIKKRTERLMEELKIEKEDFTDEPKIAYLMQEIEANKKVLNLIQKQDTEINKLNKEIKQLKEDISNMYNEKVVRNILEDYCDLSKYEIDELLN